MNDTTSKRRRIIDLLELFSSEAAQLDYEKNVPHVDITIELISMWFDDEYHPKSKDLGDYFSANEIEFLDDFHQYYDSRVHDLPESNGTVQTWLNDPTWQEIMTKALQTLEKLKA